MQVETPIRKLPDIPPVLSGSWLSSPPLRVQTIQQNLKEITEGGGGPFMEVTPL